MTKEEGRNFLKPFRFDQLPEDAMSDQMKKNHNLPWKKRGRFCLFRDPI